MIRLTAILPLAIIVFMTSCNNDDDGSMQPQACDFSQLTVSANETYAFDENFADYFSQSSRWESEDADITLVNEKGQLTANSSNTSQALEAWKLFKTQMPYDRSWDMSIEVHIPSYWNSNGGNDAQVGAGIFVGKPVATGQSAKVYECNFATVNGGGRFVQAQLIANRLGDDPIDVQHTTLDNTKENAVLKIQFCAPSKSLSLFIDNALVGNSKSIDASGLDNWNLSDYDVMDVGIMGFAENTIITSHQPTLDNFEYRIY